MNINQSLIRIPWLSGSMIGDFASSKCFFDQLVAVVISIFTIAPVLSFETTQDVQFQHKYCLSFYFLSPPQIIRNQLKIVSTLIVKIPILNVSSNDFPIKNLQQVLYLWKYRFSVFSQFSINIHFVIMPEFNYLFFHSNQPKFSLSFWTFSKWYLLTI